MIKVYDKENFENVSEDHKDTLVSNIRLGNH